MLTKRKPSSFLSAWILHTTEVFPQMNSLNFGLRGEKCLIRPKFYFGFWGDTSNKFKLINLSQNSVHRGLKKTISSILKLLEKYFQEWVWERIIWSWSKIICQTNALFQDLFSYSKQGEPLNQVKYSSRWKKLITKTWMSWLKNCFRRSKKNSLSRPGNKQKQDQGKRNIGKPYLQTNGHAGTIAFK